MQHTPHTTHCARAETAQSYELRVTSVNHANLTVYSRTDQSNKIHDVCAVQRPLFLRARGVYMVARVVVFIDLHARHLRTIELPPCAAMICGDAAVTAHRGAGSQNANLIARLASLRVWLRAVGSCDRARARAPAIEIRYIFF